MIGKILEDKERHIESIIGLLAISLALVAFILTTVGEDGYLSFLSSGGWLSTLLGIIYFVGPMLAVLLILIDFSTDAQVTRKINDTMRWTFFAFFISTLVSIYSLFYHYFMDILF